MQVNFYATLRYVVGSKMVNFNLPDRVTVQQLLDEMLRCYPALRRELVDEQGNLYPHVHIFVNGRDARFLEHAMDSELTTDDSISVFPAVGGG